MNEEYTIYDEEWKDALMKQPKIYIISVLRMVCLERDELEQAIESQRDLL